jgi:pyrroloquinoline-quinone synthase
MVSRRRSPAAGASLSVVSAPATPPGTETYTLPPRCAPPVTTVATLDRMIRARHLLKHPFYTAWSKGEVSLPTLGRYAEQYFQFESNFPRYVAATYARLTDAAIRRPLLENLVDEEGRAPTHPDLWLDFARALGKSPAAVRRAPPMAGTRHLLDTYARATFGRSAAEGLGALYAYESIFPEVAAEKSRGLREQYGITDPRAHEFFRVHTVADVEHSGAERAAMRSVLRNDRAAGPAMARGCRRSIDAWWGFLDGFPRGA